MRLAVNCSREPVIELVLLRWIHSLAKIEERLLELLRYARAGEWAYGRQPSTIASEQIGADLCESMGWPAEAGMPNKVE